MAKRFLSRVVGVNPPLVLAACAFTAALTLAAANSGIKAASDMRAQTVVPSCPHAIYAADGNMRPLFCVIDNPTALRYFAPMAKHTFALGQNATPGQVSAALIADFKHGGTSPILCSIYRLAAWRNRWSFGVSPVDNIGSRLNFPSGWCREPSFNGIE